MLEHEFVDGSIQAFQGTTINAVGGDDRGNSFSVQNGSSALNNGRSFTMAVPTPGYENISLSYATQRTSTGFTIQAVAYSTDGVNFTDIAVIDDIPGSFALRTVSLGSIPEAADSPSLYLRVTVEGGNPS